MKKFALLFLLFSVITICFGQYNYDVFSINKKIGISNTLEYSEIDNIYIAKDVNNILMQTVYLKDGSVVECPVSEIDSVSFNRDGYNINPIVFINIPHKFSEFSYLNSKNFLCFKNEGNSHLYAKGMIENKQISLSFDSLSRLSSYNDYDIMLSFDYSKLDSVGFVYISIQDYLKGEIENDSIYVTNLSEKRNISSKNMTSTHVLRNIINYALDKLENGLSALQAFKLLYETDEMDHNKKLDYILNEEYKLIPRKWVDRILENFDNNDILNFPPSYFIDVKTVDATNVTAINARLPIDGYIYGIANDGKLNFEYGVIYSTSPDFDIYSGDIISSTWNHTESISSINITLPKSFTTPYLKPDTKYYYRAFWRNLDCMSMCTYGEIKSFKTEKMII